MTLQKQTNSLSTLRDLVPRGSIPQPVVEPVKFEGEFPGWYKTVRNGITSKIYLTDIRKDTAYFKERVEDKHTSSMSIQKLIKFYKSI